jgi:hypothetical protein
MQSASGFSRYKSGAGNLSGEISKAGGLACVVQDGSADAVYARAVFGDASHALRPVAGRADNAGNAGPVGSFGGVSFETLPWRAAGTPVISQLSATFGPPGAYVINPRRARHGIHGETHRSRGAGSTAMVVLRVQRSALESPTRSQSRAKASLETAAVN